MKRAFNIFNKSMEETKVCSALYDYLDNQLKLPLDYSDILRWQWAQSVSAFDKLIHDLILQGMIEEFEGRLPQTSKFKSFPLTTKQHFLITSNPSSSSIEFSKIVSDYFRHLSFQASKKISEGLSYIWLEEHKWQKIALAMSKNESDVKTQVDLIATRRNQIVHQNDYIGFTRQNIDKVSVDEVICFITRLGETIYNLIDT